MFEYVNPPIALRPAEVEHAHHWVIEEARGPLSRGTCKRCGAERQFRNWLGESDFSTQEEHRQVA